MAKRNSMTVPKLARLIRREAPRYTREQAEEIAWGILRAQLVGA